MIQAGLRSQEGKLQPVEQPHHNVPQHQAGLPHPPPFQVDTFCPPFSSYLATPFILLPMKYEMAVRGKQQLVKEWGEKMSEACLTSQEDDLLESLVKKE